MNAIHKILSNKEKINESHKWWIILFARLSSSTEPLNLRNILIGIAGAVTLGFAWRRLIIADQQKEAQVKQTNSQVRQTEIESERRLNERFDNAAAALSKELDESSFPAHLGAISSLSVLAINSAENTQRCLDIICSCNQWMEEYIEEFNKIESWNPYSSLLLHEYNRIGKKGSQNKIGKITLLHEKRSQEALAAISHILAKISASKYERIKELKFHNKMLCGISLRDVTLDGINFEGTYLVGASLDNTSLKKAKLNSANLEGAYLARVHLERASLDHANLERVALISAQLAGASFNYANIKKAFLIVTHLEGASLYNANLEGANLVQSNLVGASLDHTNFKGASLDQTNIRGASLVSANLQGASLISANIEGASLESANLQEGLLINTQLQGAIMDKVDLSDSMLLDCNLYGVTLKEIKSENIMFNGIVKIGYIKEGKERQKHLDDICQHLKPDNAKLFIKRMEAAWQAVEKNQEPDGLDIIRKNSMITEDSQGMYDISGENLTNLQERWDKQVNDKDINFLYSIKNTLSSLTDKNSELNKKLEILIDQLILNNEKRKRIKK